MNLLLVLAVESGCFLAFQSLESAEKRRICGRALLSACVHHRAEHVANLRVKGFAELVVAFGGLVSLAFFEQVAFARAILSGSDRIS